MAAAPGQAFAIVTQQEAKAVAVAEHLALDEVELVDQRVGATTVAQHLAVAFHSSHATTHGFVVIFVFQAQQTAHFFMRDRFTILL